MTFDESNHKCLDRNIEDDENILEDKVIDSNDHIENKIGNSINNEKIQEKKFIQKLKICRYVSVCPRSNRIGWYVTAQFMNANQIYWFLYSNGVYLYILYINLCDKVQKNMYHTYGIYN